MKRLSVRVGSTVKYTWRLPVGSEEWGSTFQPIYCKIYEILPDASCVELDPDNVVNSNIGTAGYIDIERQVTEIGEWRYAFKYLRIDSHDQSEDYHCYEEFSVKVSSLQEPTIDIPMEQLQ